MSAGGVLGPRHRTVWMGNIQPDWDDNKLEALLRHCGVEPIPKIEVKRNARKGWKDSEGNRIGFALLEFESTELADHFMMKYSDKEIAGTSQLFNLKKNAWASNINGASSEDSHHKTVDSICDDLIAGHLTAYGGRSSSASTVGTSLDEPTSEPPLESQLDPLNIAQLRERLITFGFDTAELERHAQQHGGRVAKKTALVSLLCRLYRSIPSQFPRRRVYLEGRPVPQQLLDPLLSCLRTTVWPPKKRNVTASEYLVIGLPAPDSTAPKHMDSHATLWSLAAAIIKDMDPDFQYTSLAVTKNFVSSPHTDANDKGAQYALSLGEFSSAPVGSECDEENCGGGELCVEASASKVCVINTKGRLARVDGRFPHWVRSYVGERFSLIFYRVAGECEPKQCAVLQNGVS